MTEGHLLTVLTASSKRIGLLIQAKNCEVQVAEMLFGRCFA